MVDLRAERNEPTRAKDQSIEQCPCCGSYLPTPKLFKGKRRQAIYDYIRTHPECDINAIYGHVYASDPNGGPCSNSVSVLLVRMKQVLAEHGLKIESCRGQGATYKLVSIERTAA